MYKEFFTAAAIALTFVAYFPYVRSIHRGETKPHVFSWVTWGCATGVVFFAQLAAGAGVGAWPTGVSGLVALYVAFTSYRQNGDTNITRLDWMFFISAMSSLPFWYVTDDPLYAVMILTTVDLLAFAPTVRKSYYAPHEERTSFYTLMAIRGGLVIAALETYSWATVLFPAVAGGSCIPFVIMVLYRRRVLARAAV